MNRRSFLSALGLVAGLGLARGMGLRTTPALDTPEPESASSSPYWDEIIRKWYVPAIIEARRDMPQLCVIYGRDQHDRPISERFTIIPLKPRSHGASHIAAGETCCTGFKRSRSAH